MRRSPAALATLVAVALTVAACGGSSKSSDSPGTGGTGASGSGSGGDAAAILGSIDRSVTTGPQKVKLDVTADIKGTSSNPQLAAFTKEPIHLVVDGVVDSAGGKGDVNVSVTLGKTPIEAEIRYGEGKSWIQIAGKWYDAAGALSSATGQSLPAGASAGNLDAGKLLAELGDPSKLFENTSVSSEKVDGIDSDKVSGDINIAAAATAGARLAAASGGSTAVKPSQAEVDKLVAQADKIVKKAHVDLWVGKSDHKVHRMAIAFDAVMDDATKTSTGIESLTLNLDVTTVASDAPDVSAPASVGSQTEFQTAVIGLLGQVMGGASAG
jgi:hypothetical protein